MSSPSSPSSFARSAGPAAGPSFLDLVVDARTTVRFRVDPPDAVVDGSLFAYATNPWLWNLAFVYFARCLAPTGAVSRLCVEHAEWLPPWLRERMPRYECAFFPRQRVAIDLRVFVPQGDILRTFAARRAAACVARQILDPSGCKDVPLALRVSELAHLMVLYRVHMESLLLELHDLLPIAPGSDTEQRFLQHARDILHDMRFVHRPVFHFMRCITTVVCMFADS